jgi:hypothetical protein
MQMIALWDNLNRTTASEKFEVVFDLRRSMPLLPDSSRLAKRSHRWSA